MHIAIRPAQRVVHRKLDILCSCLPPFLCPALRHTSTLPFRWQLSSNGRRIFATSLSRRSTVQDVLASMSEPPSKVYPSVDQQQIQALPLQCPGCGAPTQTVAADEAGYYNLERKWVRNYINQKPQEKSNEEGVLYQAATQAGDPELLKGLGFSPEVPLPETVPLKPPVCDRCHKLIHHHTGTPIHHPSIDSIQATIEESPHKRNHIYHVVDAADFPMSLIPQLQYELDLSPQRSKNRRSKQVKFQHDRVIDVSFIITRADLLAPLKDQVDTLFPYVQDVLRETIERKARRKIRLGNVHMVSAQRGWWTKDLKEKIWQRGGANWMVGKANVGKSNLFEVVFPKGRADDVKELRRAAKEEVSESPAQHMDDLLVVAETGENDAVEEHVDSSESANEVFDDELSLLPPAQKEVPYPEMPTVSDLPGTTAAPIRIPFGNGRGELIDLPGMFRSDIEKFVLPEHRLALVMKNRVVPEKIVMKQDKSLLLGNLIRITPTSPDVIISHSFVTLKPHLTSTLKAVDIHNGTLEKHIESIVTPEGSASMRSAGRFKLKWDMTKAMTGPLTRRDAGKVKTSQLPFVVLSTDILIEGIGWVELTAQVRRRRLEEALDTENPLETYPEVEIFSPEGRFIAQRRPMGASLLGAKKEIPKHLRRARPRMSMKSVKARRKPKDRNGGTGAEAGENSRSPKSL